MKIKMRKKLNETRKRTTIEIVGTALHLEHLMLESSFVTPHVLRRSHHIKSHHTGIKHSSPSFSAVSDGKEPSLDRDTTSILEDGDDDRCVGEPLKDEEEKPF